MYRYLSIDNILTDDYDSQGWIDESKRSILSTGLRANLAPEGYYYQAHYPIEIREFEENVNKGYHTKVTLVTNNKITNGTVTVVLDKNYYFNQGDEIYLYDKATSLKHIGVISSVSNDFKTITITKLTNLENKNTKDFNFFKPNFLKPSTAYDINDGTGLYLWKNFKSYEHITSESELYDTTFTNGAHYLHKQINFYLKRQDPTGVYGLQPSHGNFGEATQEYGALEIDGEIKNVSDGEYLEPGENNCLRF
jgi:hypothetical protein